MPPDDSVIAGRHCIDNAFIWGVSRKLATSVNQGDRILTMMDVLKCTQITLLKSY